jgi:hypothetical protein
MTARTRTRPSLDTWLFAMGWLLLAASFGLLAALVFHLVGASA